MKPYDIPVSRHSSQTKTKYQFSVSFLTQKSECQIQRGLNAPIIIIILRISCSFLILAFNSHRMLLLVRILMGEHKFRCGSDDVQCAAPITFVPIRIKSKIKSMHDKSLSDEHTCVAWRVASARKMWKNSVWHKQLCEMNEQIATNASTRYQCPPGRMASIPTTV